MAVIFVQNTLLIAIYQRELTHVSYYTGVIGNIRLLAPGGRWEIIWKFRC